MGDAYAPFYVKLNEVEVGEGTWQDTEGKSNNYIETIEIKKSPARAMDSDDSRSSYEYPSDHVIEFSLLNIDRTGINLSPEDENGRIQLQTKIKCFHEEFIDFHFYWEDRSNGCERCGTLSYLIARTRTCKFIKQKFLSTIVHWHARGFFKRDAVAAVIVIHDATAVIHDAVAVAAVVIIAIAVVQCQEKSQRCKML